MYNNSIKILCIGNSFSVDTTCYVAEIAKSLGISHVKIANLFIGGCPVSKHYYNLQNDLPAYRYDRNTGSGWTQTPNHKISDAITEESWDWISIQHGTSYGGRYAEEDSYRDLPMLVAEVKRLAGNNPNIAFNLTWVGEPAFDHREMQAFSRDHVRYFNAICDITQRVVAPVAGIDLVCPTGTAVLNARTTALSHRLHRDGYHLSGGVGRYLAGLTFLRALTGVPIENVTWMPSGVDEKDRALILKAVNLAIEKPYCISAIDHDFS